MSDEQDAKRYRWLRNYGFGILLDVFNTQEPPHGVEPAAVALDAAIDRQLNKTADSADGSHER